MAYVKKTWENKPSTASPINANNLNHMEQGIKDNDDHIEDVDLYLQTVAGEVNNLISEKMNKANPTFTGNMTGGANVNITGDFTNGYGETLHGGLANKVNTSNPTFTGNMTGGANITLTGDYTNGYGETLHGIYEALPVDNESGNPCVITDAFGGACKSLKLTLEPIQSGSGTPSPQNVRPISGRTQSIVTRTGKNLLPLPNNGASFQDLVITIQKDINNNPIGIVLNGTVSTQRGWEFFSGTLKAGTYTFSGVFSGTGEANVLVYSSDYSTTYAFINPSRTSASFTLNADTFVRIQTYVYTTEAYNNFIIQPMIRPSTITDDTFVPYNVTGYTIQLGQTVYGGVLDVSSGVLTVDRVLETFDGSADEVWGADGHIYYVSMSNNVAYQQLPMLNMYKGVGRQGAQYLNNNEAGFSIGSSVLNYINIRDDSISSLNDWKTYISSHNVQVCYELSTPTTVQLTPTQIALLHGDNVLTTDADSIDVEYAADIALYIAKKISEGISQGNRSLSKGGVSEEDLKEEVKEEEIEIKEEPLTKEVH